MNNTRETASAQEFIQLLIDDMNVGMEPPEAYTAESVMKELRITDPKIFDTLNGKRISWPESDPFEFTGWYEDLIEGVHFQSNGDGVVFICTIPSMPGRTYTLWKGKVL